MKMILALDNFFTTLARICGVLACIAMLLLLANVFYDVVMRYAFNDVSIAMQELEWHLFSVVFLLGIPYAIKENSHVRVDILYDRWSEKTKAWVNLLGAIFFILPVVVLVTIYSVDFAMDAYEIGEGSGDPGGLPNRWIIKSLIPFSFVMLGLTSIGMVTQGILTITNQSNQKASQVSSQF